METLPVNGRNWMDLAMLAPGSRQNQSSGAPLMRQGYSQINVDGQQVTVNFIGVQDDQARFSRDVIAEFDLITNGFATGPIRLREVTHGTGNPRRTGTSRTSRVRRSWVSGSRFDALAKGRSMSNESCRNGAGTQEVI